MGKKHTGLSIVPSANYHRMHDDLSTIVRSEIDKLNSVVASGRDLDIKELKRLDTCFDGLKKLLDIEKLLRTDRVSSMTDAELLRAARKALREKPKHGDNKHPDPDVQAS